MWHIAMPGTGAIHSINGAAMAHRCRHRRSADRVRWMRTAGHKGNRPMAAAYGAGMPRPSPPPPRSARCRGSDDPVFKSSTVARLRHFATVLGLMPSSRLSAASKACDHSGLPSDRWRAGPRYCSLDSVRGRGASANLSHRASVHAKERIAPSNRGSNSWPSHSLATAAKVMSSREPTYHRACAAGHAVGFFITDVVANSGPDAW